MNSIRLVVQPLISSNIGLKRVINSIVSQFTIYIVIVNTVLNALGLAAHSFRNSADTGPTRRIAHGPCHLTSRPTV